MNAVVNGDMHDYWNDAGGRMWLEHQDIIEAGMLPLGIKAMDELSIVAGERVLDIGCGCGDTTLEIAQRVGKGGHVLGVDISEMLILSARNNVHNNGQSNLFFDCVDAQIHPFATETFDVVFSRLGVMFFDNPIAAFSNVLRSLRPGGRMAFVCWQPIKAIEWIRMPLEVAARHIELPPPKPVSPDSPGGFSFGDETRVVDILESAGFVGVKANACNLRINIGKTLKQAETFLAHIGPTGTVLDELDIDSNTRARFTEDLREALTAHQTEQGVQLGAAIWLVSARKA